MRMLILVPLLLAGACAETAEGDTKTVEKAAQIDPGQWETVVEVTQFTTMDGGKPAIDTPAGTRLTASTCIGAGDAARPDPVLFTAVEEGSCEYKNLYMKNGRLNGGLTCKRPGLGGDLLASLEGTFTADTIEGKSVADTYLPGDGDVKIASRISGRRIGDCAKAA